MTDIVEETPNASAATAPERSNRSGPAPTEPRGEIAGGAWRLGLVIAATFALGFAFRLSIVFTVLAVIVMIFLHELGHYLTAKWAGMKVTEFFIGFGPKIWSFRRGETEYGLKGIPAGAYVRIIGMHNLEEVPPEDEARTYRQKSYPRRLSVAVAGSTMHFLQALVLIWIVLTFSSVSGGSIEAASSDSRTDESWVVSRVGEGTAADDAGLQDGDRVVDISGNDIATFDDLSAYVVDRPGEPVSLTVLRDGETLTLVTTLGVREEDPSAGFLGIGLDIPAVDNGPIEAIPTTFSDFGFLMRESTVALADFFTPGTLGNFFGKVTPEDTATPAPGSTPTTTATVADENPAEDRLLSIYGAVRLGADLFESGWEGAAFFLISINVFVGIFNLIPLLPFDGGHVAIATYERIRSTKERRYFADVGKLLPLTYAVVMFVVLIGVTSLYLDVAQPIN